MVQVLELQHLQDKQIHHYTTDFVRQIVQTWVHKDMVEEEWVILCFIIERLVRQKFYKTIMHKNQDLVYKKYNYAVY